ncbi:MAG: bifunctional methylenetetrahydrofolate dehydrogenase/methenyltetrahydrofolate cyclohydrolase FolD [Chloroflexi bacterium]|nr:bifunctional methylenetetrahydrofolate dehydrogenase/methenyltetrahydrofolate cyclohydrolase FolD [Chloroflexota bacterium]
MTAKLIKGKPIAEAVLAEAAEEVKRLQATSGITPGLAAVLVGEDPASQIYVRNKTRTCHEIGVFAQTFNRPADTSQAELLRLIDELNHDDRFHGVLVQLPLPSHITGSVIIEAVDPNKDVDGLHPVNLGRLAAGEPTFVSATPLGIQQMLLRSGYDPEGKHVVICGRSVIVGRPMALLLIQKAPGGNATVTMCHTRTRDVGSFTRQADILIVSTGVPRWVTADMVKEGAVVIDVGITRIEDPTAKKGTRLVGDVVFDEVSEKAEAITPVPGGVGPMTVAMVVSNTIKAAQQATRETNSR